MDQDAPLFPGSEGRWSGRPLPKNKSPRRSARSREQPRLNIRGLDNLCRFWRKRAGLPPAQRPRLSEYLVEALAETLGKASWDKALREALRRVSAYYPPDLYGRRDQWKNP